MTKHLRAGLPSLLSRLGVRTLLDIPCGDFNWMSAVDLSGIDYIGADNEERRLAKARAHTTNAASATFIRLDALAAPLPDVDAVICRDFLQHIPTAAVMALLPRLADTAEFLLLTSFDSAENTDIEIGGFRRLNLCAAPFNLPPPIDAIEDPPGSGRVLGVWRGSDVNW